MALVGPGLMIFRCHAAADRPEGARSRGPCPRRKRFTWSRVM